MNIVIKIRDLVKSSDRFGPGPKDDIGNEVPEDLSIKVPENLKMVDKMGTYKPWFNGMKHFYTVKPSPPKNDSK